MMHKMPSTRRLIYAALIVVLLAFLPLLIQKGVANAYHFKTLFYLKLWEGNQQPSKAQFQQAKVAAVNAYSLDNSNPHYILSFAKVLEWGAYHQFYDIDVKKHSQLYMTAIKLRPLWPNAYADYGASLAFLNSDLDTAWPLLEKGLRYGPYTPEVLRQVLAVGFFFWPQLSVEQKKLVLETSLVAVESQWSMKLELQQLTRNYQRTSVVCSYMKYTAIEISEAGQQWVSESLCHHFYKRFG
ncbi:hypothetical protein Q4601_16930 [Shewanella sp. 1_MG-2023]|uniref:Tetratricopeptide repeat protein n=1 Tax=Shewanella electrodiphila TaxID=934143 RepID=A0ABT0KQS2_9GAMM|nr:MULTISPECIES: hypothetical protein [Shewanella]MCL1046202.1 hypothetical protein [Shewanella electrodiphila]MDO6613510.1 hypothetical protein [Shewanella sp. 7_MG-2023]MDO6773340.1 hypothetical protein [Shewanella sp. 2_MG-2023]MDO6795991.1 hypothetical protein [Shewanella sp. 1_MG-2023]